MKEIKDSAPGALRPALSWFAGELEMELKKHDFTKGQNGWLGNDLRYHLNRAISHALEIQTTTSIQGAMKHCIHGANHFMMLADNLRVQLEKGILGVKLDAEKRDKVK